jgi:ABC-type antimicrobial peptide transport system permease subunit
VIRTEGEPAASTEAVRAVIRKINGKLPVDIRTLTELRREVFASSDALIALFLVFAVFALVMAAMGIYGVISYAVSLRQHEIGIRMALGAGAADVSRMMVFQGAKLVAAGIGMGMVGAFLLSRMLSKVVLAVSVTDPLSFIGVPLILVLVAIAANYAPVRRATRIDPMATLRTE